MLHASVGSLAYLVEHTYSTCRNDTFFGTYSRTYYQTARVSEGRFKQDHLKKNLSTDNNTVKTFPVDMDPWEWLKTKLVVYTETIMVLFSKTHFQNFVFSGHQKAIERY